MSAAIMKSIKPTTTTNFVSLCIFGLKNNFEIKIRDNQTGDDLKKEIIKKITSNKENQEKIQNSIFIKFLGGKKIDDKKTIKDNGLESDSILSVNLCILGGVRWCPIKLEHTTYGAGDYDRSYGKYNYTTGSGYSDGKGGYSTTGKTLSSSYSSRDYSNNDKYWSGYSSNSSGYSSNSGGYSSNSGGYSSNNGGYSSKNGSYSSNNGSYSYPSGYVASGYAHSSSSYSQYTNGFGSGYK